MYLVIGANGYIGSYFLKNILEKTDDDIIATGRNIDNIGQDNKRITWIKTDITDRKSVTDLSEKIKNICRDLKIVFLAAYHHPDDVEANPQLAWDVNVTSLSYFINKISNVKCLFYASSEMVYGNSEDLFTEKSELNPVNRYGIHKKVAESIILGYGYNVVRYPVLIGPSIIKEKKHFYDYIVNTISSGKKIEMFMDTYKSMLDFNTATSLTIDIIEQYNTDIPKIINISGDDKLSKYDVGCMIADKYNVSREFIKPISIFSNNNIFKENRANSTILDNSLLKSILKIPNIKISI